MIQYGNHAPAMHAAVEVNDVLRDHTRFTDVNYTYFAKRLPTTARQQLSATGPSFQFVGLFIQLVQV